MNKLVTMVLLSSPALILILYITMHKMEKHDIEMEQQKIEFGHEQNEFKEDFEAFLDPKKEAALHAKRAKEREEREAKVKAEEEQLQGRRAENNRRSREFDNDFEAALKAFDGAKQGGGK